MVLANYYVAYLQAAFNQFDHKNTGLVATKDLGNVLRQNWSFSSHLLLLQGVRHQPKGLLDEADEGEGIIIYSEFCDIKNLN